MRRAMPVSRLLLPLLALFSSPAMATGLDGAAIWARECAACHALTAGDETYSGPHLDGLLGRQAGSVAGFDYSDAFLQSTHALIWDMQQLEALLEAPQALIPGSRMAYAGLRDPDERAALLLWLAEAPQEPATEMDLPPEVLALEGDVEYGAYLAQECTTCHRPQGSAGGIPPIAGWPAPRFVQALHAYREGQRRHETMQTIARRLTDEDIAALAAYFADINN